MPEQGHFTAAVGQGEGPVDNGGGLLDEHACCALDFRDVAAQGVGMAPVPVEIKGNRDVAAPGEGECVGPHELLRSRETVTDHDDGCRGCRHGGGSGRSEDAYGRAVDDLRRGLDAG